MIRYKQSARAIDFVKLSRKKDPKKPDVEFGSVNMMMKTKIRGRSRKSKKEIMKRSQMTRISDAALSFVNSRLSFLGRAP